MREGAARALAEVLRRRRPDFAWEVVISPLDRPQRNSMATGRKVVGRVPTSDQTNPIGDMAPSLADPDDRKSAA